MTSIVILGMPKSGTSALYAAIKQRGGFLSMYEPGNARQLSYLARSPESAKLVKILYPKLFEFDGDVSFFDKKVMIVRDPRDMLISWLLFRPLLHRNFDNSEFIDALLAALHEKEARPESWSVTQLYGLFDQYGLPYTRTRDWRRQFEMGNELRARYPDMITVRYEDFVDGNLDEVSDYLGFEISNSTRVGKHINYNERSKRYGNWRNWLTEEDVAAFRPVFQKYIEQEGYDSEWRLADHPVIDTATSAGYLTRSVERLRRFSPNFGDLKEADYYTPEYVEILQSAISDGAEGAMIELGLAHLVGYGVEQQHGKTMELLHEARERGNPLAMVHLGLAHEQGVAVEPDAARARGLFHEAAKIRSNQRVKEMINRLRPVWQEQKAATPAAAARIAV